MKEKNVGTYGKDDSIRRRYTTNQPAAHALPHFHSAHRVHVAVNASCGPIRIMNDASGGKIEVENKKIKVFFLFEHLLHKNQL